MTVHEERDVEVAASGVSRRWRLLASVERGASRLQLVGDDQAWEAVGPDVFEALRSLRRELDARGLRVGVNGARPNAWSSGMQRDMGLGRMTYLCELGDFGGMPTVGTLDPAPLAEVGTVADQDEFHAEWLADRGNAP